jgi:hypothetical protein
MKTDGYLSLFGWQIQFEDAASADHFGPEGYRDFAEFQRKAVDAVEQAFIIQ